MRTNYQKAFDHVTASDRLKEEVLNMTKQEKETLRRQIPKAVLVAAIIILILAGTAVAVSVPSIQDWFQQYWQEASGDAAMTAEQAAAIGQMTQSVGSSAQTENPEAEADESPAAVESLPLEGDSPVEKPSGGDTPEAPGGSQASVPAAIGDKPAAEAGGATVTLDSVTVGEKHLWLLLHISGTFESGKSYSFERSELIGAPEKVYSDLGIKIGTGLTYGPGGCKIFEDGSLQILAQYQSPDPNADLTAGGELCLHLENLLMDREPLLEGQWDIPFTLEQVAPLPTIKLENISIPVSGSEIASDVYFLEIHVMTTGMELICDAQYAGSTLWPDVALVLTDGREIEAGAAHASWEGETDVSRWITDYTWKVPIALEQASSVRIGDVLIPLR